MAPTDGEPPADEAATEPALAAAAEALYGAVAARLAGYVERLVVGRLSDEGSPPHHDARAAAAEAGRLAEADVLPRLAALLAADVDEQQTTPLQLVRLAIPYATAALDRLGATPADRDRFEQDRFPEDRYRLVPASLGAIDEGTGEAAIVWGAAKAMAHRRRHGGRPEGPGGGAGPGTTQPGAAPCS